MSDNRSSAVGSPVLLPVRNGGTRHDGAMVCHPQRARFAPSQRGTWVSECIRFFPRSQLILCCPGKQQGVVASRLNRAAGGLDMDLSSPPRDWVAKTQDELLGQVFDSEMPFTFLQVSFRWTHRYSTNQPRLGTAGL